MRKGELKMPRQVTLKELKNKIGEKNAQKLYDEFAGMIIYIPKKGILYFLIL